MAHTAEFVELGMAVGVVVAEAVGIEVVVADRQVAPVPKDMVAVRIGCLVASEQASPEAQEVLANHIEFVAGVRVVPERKLVVAVAAELAVVTVVPEVLRLVAVQDTAVEKWPAVVAGSPAPSPVEQFVVLLA